MEKNLNCGTLGTGLGQGEKRFVCPLRITPPASVLSYVLLFSKSCSKICVREYITAETEVNKHN